MLPERGHHRAGLDYGVHPAPQGPGHLVGQLGVDLPGLGGVQQLPLAGAGVVTRAGLLEDGQLGLVGRHRERARGAQSAAPGMSTSRAIASHIERPCSASSSSAPPARAPTQTRPKLRTLAPRATSSRSSVDHLASPADEP